MIIRSRFHRNARERWERIAIHAVPENTTPKGVVIIFGERMAFGLAGTKGEADEN